MYQSAVAIQTLLRRVAPIAAAALLLGACGDTGGTGGVNLSPDQTVRFPVGQDLGNLDPALVQGEPEQNVDHNVFDTLVRDDNPTGAVLPDLATGLPTMSADGKDYTFNLVPTAHFSNGDPLTAADMVYSWSRAAALGGPQAAIFAAIGGYAATVAAGAAGTPLSGLTATNDHTLEVKLASAQSYFLDRLALPVAAAVDSKVIASAGDRLGRQANRDWANHPATLVGTGPYRMTARSPGLSVDFAPVPNWWGTPKPIVRSVHVVVAQAAPDPAATFLAGGFDLLGYLGLEHFSVDELTRLTQSSSSELKTVARGATTWVGFDYKQGPFAGSGDKATMLRQAFALAVDRQKLATVYCQDSGTCIVATGGLTPPGIQGYGGDSTDSLAQTDAVRAKDLLHQADPDGTATRGLVVAMPGVPADAALFGFLQAQWQTVLGVHVDRAAAGATAPLFVQRAALPYDDPQGLLVTNFVVSGGGDRGSFTDGTVDELLATAAGQSATDSLATYAQVSQRLQADAAYVPLFYDSGNLAENPRVVGAALGGFADSPWVALKVLQ